MKKTKIDLMAVKEQVKFNSDYFECRKCGYQEARRVLGDISTTPCPKCGATPMYRVK